MASTDFCLLPYPREAIINQPYVLHGRYAGASDMDYLHKFEALGTKSLFKFSGFSGGAVFAWNELPGSRGKIVLCGMALRGAKSSGLFPF